MAQAPKTIVRPYRAMVLQADPDYEREKRNEIEYEFPTRTFRGNPATRGPYAARTTFPEPEDATQIFPGEPQE